MQFIIDQTDLERLSPPARDELLALIMRSVPRSGALGRNKKGFRWRAPYDLTPELTKKLIRGLDKESKKRLQLFTNNGGRVTMRELLAVTGDEDWHALSPFEGAVTRKLRRLVGDKDKIVSLVMWDYGAEKWDPEHKTLVDGVYYVSDKTAESLRAYFGTA